MVDPVEQIATAAIDEYNRQLGEAGRSGWERWAEERRRAGLPLNSGTGTAPYGHRWKQIVVLEEEPYEQTVLELEHQMFSAGMSDGEVADALNALGYLTRQAKPWTHTTLHHHRKRLGYPPWEPPPSPSTEICSVRGCGRQGKRRTQLKRLPVVAVLCGLHYRRHLETGMVGPPNHLPRPKGPRKTHCQQGHEYTEENSYVTPQGKRFCRICNREKVRRWRERHPELEKARKAEYRSRVRSRA